MPQASYRSPPSLSGSLPRQRLRAVLAPITLVFGELVALASLTASLGAALLIASVLLPS